MTFFNAMAAIAAGGAAVGLSHQARATWASRRHHDGWEVHQVAAESTNLLTCYRKQGRPGAPELFFESGLMNTSTSWLLTADELGRDYTIIVYDRAGYRRSLRRAIEPYTLAESASDAADVVRALRGSPAAVFLVGHSIGGYLCHRVAALVGDLDGVIALDPMHPRELVASVQQRQGARGTDLTLRTGPCAIAVGGGLMMDKDGILQSAARSPYLPQLADELSALSTWSTAAREWKFTYPWMLDGGVDLDAVNCPVHVIGASGTIDKSNEQRELFDTYIASGSTPGTIEILGDTDHLGVVHSADQVEAVARAIRKIAAAPSSKTESADVNEVEIFS